MTLEPGCSEKCFSHYRRPLNWRNELCRWSPWNLYNVTAGHLLGLDLQDVREGSGSWDGAGLKDLGCLRESLLVVLPLWAIQPIVFLSCCSWLLCLTYIWLLGHVFRKRLFSMCLSSCQGLTENAMSLGDKLFLLERYNSVGFIPLLQS